jgi:hypothetical protein
MVDIAQFNRMQLGAGLGDLARCAGLNLDVDWNSLKGQHAPGDQLDLPWFGYMPVEDSLEYILGDGNGGARLWNVRDGTLYVHAAQQRPKPVVLVRVYNLAPLQSKITQIESFIQSDPSIWSAPDHPRRHFKQNSDLNSDIGELIIETIDPETWRTNDPIFGIGEITELPGVLIVKHTAQTHRRIERLLQLLDGAP